MKQKQNQRRVSGAVPKDSYKQLWHIGFNTIKELETDEGILASGREEIYGCVFGRDSLITSLKLLRAYHASGDQYFLTVVNKVLNHLMVLQGKNVVLESGEEPGKIIHEYRPNNHEHLTKRVAPPWYVYDDNIMRNYDSVDATPLFLIAAYRYLEAVDWHGVDSFLPAVHSALEWLLVYGDSNHDGFIDYQFHPNRSFGGLKTQSWMDSQESVFFEDGSQPEYPIAPVEVQAYTYLALKLWAKYFAANFPDQAQLINDKAELMKAQFNENFIVRDASGTVHVAFAIDGLGRQLTSPRSSMGHCLWASFTSDDGKHMCILNDEYVPRIAQRLMAKDLFVPRAGIRTLSSNSSGFAANSYHNGSIWPHDTSMVIEGLRNFGFTESATRVKKALNRAMGHFKTPIELFVYDTTYGEYSSPDGQKACRKQAWSAASLLI
jgi:glycogen debranching enzyme